MTDKNVAMRFAARVAIITGAARGLGREYALLLASRGARVVVNDLGGSRDGTGKSAAADAVVQEIINLGGEAVADYNSVEDGDKIVQTAIDHFGRVDILINNAGILRDKSMMKITDEDWDLVYRVHLRGSFIATRAVWPYFRKQNYGRIVMTSSPSGIYGNFGQANYSSAKLGMLSLAKTLAIEGEKYNIKCNTILPVAASRLTEDLLPEDIFEMFKPQYVAPMVAFLSHEQCPVNGEVFEAAGGFFGRYQWKRSKGKIFTHPDDITIENIRDSWHEISDTSKYTSPVSMQDHTMQLISQLKGMHVNLEEQQQPVEEQRKQNNVIFAYNPTDVILYALSIGVSTSESGHLRYLYENDELFSVFPTFGATLSVNALYETSILYDVISKYNLEDNLIKTLHGEQYLKMYQPIPTSGKLYSKPSIIDVLDKGSGALILVEVPTYDEKKNLIFKNQLSLFMVGSGNFGGKRSSDSSVMVQCVDPPNRPPDAIVHQSTTIDQAALFRLCGDKNPLHIDPNFSLIGGFDKPILHGLCMLGFAVRHALRQFANYEASLLDAVKARFVGTVIPGQTIETRLWRSSNGDLVRVHFECFVRETSSKIISGAFVDLKQSAGGIVPLSSSDHSTGQTVLLTDSVSHFLHASPNMHSSPSHQAVETSSNNDHQPSTMTDPCQIDRIFDGILRNKIKQHPEIVQLINTIYQFNITKDGKLHTTWTLDLKNGKGDIYRDVITNGKPDCTLIVDDNVITKIFEGKDDALQAFMAGRLKVTGNIMAAQKLQQIWTENSVKGQLDVSDLDQGFSNSSNIEEDKALIESIPVSGLKCDLIFNILQTRMHEEPDLVKKITASYQFNITSNGKFATTWTAENKTNPKGIAYNGPFRGGKVDCLVTVEDDDFVRLMFGKLNPQRAFMLGKLKVKGNIMLLQRLNSIWLEVQKSGKAPEFPYIVELIEKTDLMPGVRSEMMVVELIQRLIRLPYLCKEVSTLVGFEILKDGKTVAEYTLDFTKSKETGVFDRGLPQGGQYCVLTMEDNDFVRLTYHKFTLEEAINMGRVKVSGDKSIPPKISIIFKTPTCRVRL